MVRGHLLLMASQPNWPVNLTRPNITLPEIAGLITGLLTIDFSQYVQLPNGGVVWLPQTKVIEIQNGEGRDDAQGGGLLLWRAPKQHVC